MAKGFVNMSRVGDRRGGGFGEGTGAMAPDATVSSVPFQFLKDLITRAGAGSDAKAPETANLVAQFGSDRLSPLSVNSSTADL